MYYAYMRKYNNKVQTHFSVCNEWLVFKAMATAMTALSDISSVLPNGKGYKQCWCSTADLTLNKAIPLYNKIWTQCRCSQHIPYSGLFSWVEIFVKSSIRSPELNFVVLNFMARAVMWILTLNTCEIDVALWQWVVRERGYHIHEDIWEQRGRRRGGSCPPTFGAVAPRPPRRGMLCTPPS